MKSLIAVFLVQSAARRSVATALMPDHNLVAAPFADGHVTTGSVSVVAPIVTVTIAPIVIVATVVTTLAVDSVSFTAVRSDTELELSERDVGFRRDCTTSISGECRESPHCARDGGDKWQFSHF
jgi:hypothetical protein